MNETQMDVPVDSDEWELCKENVQPLRQGRSFADMSAAIQPINSSRIKEQQDMFERELRTYSGDDPLDVWMRYIHWTEQNFLKGGTEILNLVKKCVLTFNEDKRYHDDKRFISIFIRFAHYNSEPDDLFMYMFSNNIGCKSAMMFISWASMLEQSGNTTKADAIYTKGIELGAEPVDQLRRHHHEFQARVARQLAGASAVDEPQSTSFLPTAESEPTRTTLGGLKAHGKTARVSVNRTSTGPVRGGLPAAAAAGASASNVQKSRQQLTIFSDENTVTSLLPAQNEEYSSVPLPEVITRENQQRPGKWTDAKLKQKSSIGSSRHSSHVAAASAGPTLEIYQDSDAALSLVTPHKVPSVNQVLAPRRRDPDNDPASLTSNMGSMFGGSSVGGGIGPDGYGSEGNTQRPMFCIEKLYAGNRECSFEELRAWKWMEKKKEEEKRLRELSEMVNACVGQIASSIEQRIVDMFRHTSLSQPSATRLEFPSSSSSASGSNLDATVSFNPSSSTDSNQNNPTPISNVPPHRPTVAVENFSVSADISSLLKPSIQKQVETALLGIQSQPAFSAADDEVFTVGNISTACRPRPAGNGNGFNQSVSSKLAHSVNNTDIESMDSTSMPIAEPVDDDVRGLRALPTGGRREMGDFAGLAKPGITAALAARPAAPAAAGESLIVERNSILSTSRVCDVSMTVNSKETYNLICNMFRNPLSTSDSEPLGSASVDAEFEKQFAIDNGPAKPVAIYEDETCNMPAARPVVAGTGSVPFQIYQGTGMTPAPSAVKLPAAPAFQIYQQTGLTPAPSTAKLPSSLPFEIYQQTGLTPAAAPAKLPGSSVFKIYEQTGLTPAVKGFPTGLTAGMATEHTASKIPKLAAKGLAERRIPPEIVENKENICVARNDVEMKEQEEIDDELDMGGDAGDITFNPRSSSTCRFPGVVTLPAGAAAAQRLPQIGDDDEMSFIEQDPDAAAPPAIHKRSVAARVSVTTESMESDSIDVSTKNIDRDVRKSSIYYGGNGLQTILEGSDESKSKSSIDSQGSSGNPSSVGCTGISGMMSTVGLHSQNWTSATVTPGTHLRNQTAAAADDCSQLQPNVTRAKTPFTISKYSVTVLPPASSQKPAPVPPMLEVEFGREAVTGSGAVTVNGAVTGPAYEELDATMNHMIDTTAYVPNDTPVDLNETVAIDNSNPFDEQTIEKFLSRLRVPIQSRPNYRRIDSNLPKVTARGSIELGAKAYDVLSKLGEGAYAKVFHIGLKSPASTEKVIKVQQPGCKWEFYITSELRQRLLALNSPFDVTSSVMHIDEAFFFNNGSCFIYDYQKSGTVIDLVNIFKRKNTTLEEWFVTYLTIELVTILMNVHRCNIIHGDFKPDNILVCKLPLMQDGENMESMLQRSTSCFRLIDFGQSIDMTLFPPGTTFTAAVTTDGFQCPEMKTNRPWTYQTDLFGLVGTVHVMLFGKYMSIKYLQNSWKIFSTFQRKWKATGVWKKMFTEFLNIPSCSELPDLTVYRQQLVASISDVTVEQFNAYVRQLKVELGE